MGWGVIGRRLLLAIAPLALLPAAFAGDSGSPADHPGRPLYEANCAGCHGRNLEGGLATPLVKSDWSYGRTRFAIWNNIRNGIPSAGMPAWGDRFSDTELMTLVDYILATQNARPLPVPPFPATIDTQDYRLKVEVSIQPALTIPWGIAFVDSRRALISDRAGKLFWMVDGIIDPQPVTGLPPVDHATSTGGLFDIALDPDHRRNGWVYLAFAHSADPASATSPGMTQVIRGRVDGHRWTDTQYLFRSDEKLDLPNSHSWGGRLLFDRAGNLCFSIGDMSQAAGAQELTRPNGKLLCRRPDGSPIAHPPFPSADPVTASIFSYGHRNIQGLALQPGTGAIWATEHGPHGGDELNLLKAGANYGWPIATYGVDYDGSIISEQAEKPGVEKPVRYWTPAPAVSAIDFVTGDLFPRWRGNLLMGSLSHEKLFRFVVRDNAIVGEELLFKGHGRIRDVRMAPDGAIVLIMNNPAAIVRLTPAGKPGAKMP